MPKLIKLIVTAILATAALASSSGTAAASACPNADIAASGLSPAAAEAAATCLINAARTAAGVPAATDNAALTIPARLLAAGATPVAGDLTWGRDFGANTAAPTPREAVDAWLGHAAYRPLILDPAVKELRVGYALIHIDLPASWWRSVFAIKLRPDIRLVRPIGCSGADTPITPATLAAAETAIVCLTNEERAKANMGLRNLAVDSRLTGTARAHSVDMVQRRYFAHNSPEGRTPCQRITASGYPAVCYGTLCWTGRCGENIGADWNFSVTPRAFVVEWMNSPGHKAAILTAQFQHIGVGLAAGTAQAGANRGFTATQNFGSPA